MRSPKDGIRSRKADISWCQGKIIDDFFLSSSCKKAKETGKYYLNIYLSEGEEDRDPNNGRDFKYFKATYVNPYKDENKSHSIGEVIQEEDEDEIQFDADFKEALRIK